MRSRKAIGLTVCGFLLPVLLLLIVFFRLGFLPFGSKSMLIMDMDNQYVQFFAGLRQIALGSGSLVYGWDLGLGQNFLGLFAYYLSSPFSLITLFCDASSLPLGITVMTLLKIGLCGLSFALFLQLKFRQSKLSVLLFSTAYALSGYVIGYSMCVMWLDSLIWLPLLIYALERQIDTGKAYLLIGLLFLTFLSNYYTAYMVGGFCLLYFFYYVYTTRRDRIFKRFLSFLGSALAAAGLSAFLILPTVFCMFNGKIGGNNFTETQILSFSPWLLIPKLMAGNSYDSITYDGTPFVYIGLAALLLFGVYCAAKSIPRREKGASVLLILLLLASFLITKLDLIWHVFQTPNWFPFRYAFVLSFFLLLCAYKGYLTLSRQSRMRILLPAAVCALAFMLSGKAGRGVNLLLLCLYVVLLLCKTCKPVAVKRVAVLLLVLVTSVETAWNAETIFQKLDADFGYIPQEEYTAFNRSLSKAVDSVHAADNGFYRMEKTFERSKNDAVGVAMRGISHYSSAYDRNTNDFLRHLGFAQDYIWCSYLGSTPVTDALFGIKYVLSKEPTGGDYPARMRTDDFTVYQNPYAFPIGGVLASATLTDYQPTGNPFENQNRLFSALGAQTQPCFQPIRTTLSVHGVTCDTSDGVYRFQKTESGATGFLMLRFTAESDDPVYAYFPLDEDAQPSALSVNGSFQTELFTSDTDRVQYLGRFRKGERVTLRIDLSSDSLALANLFVYRLDTSTFERAASAAQVSAFQTRSATETQIVGEVTATDAQPFLLTSIRGDEGWRVYVDGKRQAYTELSGTLICVPLTAGRYTVTFRFVPKGLVAGCTLSAATLLGLLLLFFIRRRRANKTEKE